MNIFNPSEVMGLAERARVRGAATYDQQKGYSEDRARVQAGRKVATGDYQGGAADLYGEGMLDAGSEVQNYGQAQEDRASEEQALQAKAKADGLIKVATGLRGIPAGQRSAALRSNIAMLQQLGIDPTPFAALTEDQLADQNLDLFTGQVTKAVEQYTLTPGAKRFDATGKLIAEAPAETKYEKLGPGETLIDPSGGQPAPQAAAPQAGPASPPVDDLFGALVMQESGGRAGVLGPETAYGRAEGKTQMLPATAQQMAQKIGVQWRPELMRGDTPEAAQYQEQLGRAYFDEGLQKYSGDPIKALMYYHGGPNEQLWGPKTQRYAQEVMARVQPYEQAQAGGVAAPPSGGARVIARGAPKSPEWTARGDGNLYNVSGDRKLDPTDPRNQAAAKERAPTDGDKASASFAYRAIRANVRLNELADRGIYKPRTATAQLFDRDKNGVVRIVTKTAEDRQFIQAAKEWLVPILRKDTGAAVTDNELETYMDIFIPKFEDDHLTQKQKAEARQDAMIALANQGGETYNKTYGTKRGFKSRFEPAKPAAGKPGKPSGGWGKMTVGR